nr:inactive pancreatic lipase-related protein 1-like [Leptinotarsa decemlineata]
MWKKLFIFGLTLQCVYLQIVPDDIDYTNFPLPQSLNLSEMEMQETRQAFTFGNCKMVYKPICPDPDVTFFLYTKRNPENPEALRIGSDSTVSNLKETSFDASKPTKIIIHGYNSDMNLNALVEIRKEYLKTRDYNIITVDWSPLNQAPCYLSALINIRHVGSCSAQLVVRLLEHGATDIHVIGFSLGAHVANYLAVSLRPYKLPRITGLDPALPGFLTPNLDHKLDKSDASFVDVYHTNAFIQGVVEESGHVDFYLNGGALQPGCWAENRFFACNHHRAPLYFAESINTDKGFWGWPCPSYFDYLLGRCPPHDPQIIMGDLVKRSSTGVHLVITESVSPYAVGKYDGPSIEIYLKSNLYRKDILKKYRRELLEFIDEDDLVESLGNGQEEMNDEDYFPLTDSQFVNVV